MTIDNKLLAVERLLLEAMRSVQKASVILTHIKGTTLDKQTVKIEEPECDE